MLGHPQWRVNVAHPARPLVRADYLAYAKHPAAQQPGSRGDSATAGLRIALTAQTIGFKQKVKNRAPDTWGRERLAAHTDG